MLPYYTRPRRPAFTNQPAGMAETIIGRGDFRRAAIARLWVRLQMRGGESVI